jgi:integrase
MRLKKLIERFLEWCGKARRPRTGENYRWLLLRFLKHVGNKPIDKLLPVDLEMWGKTFHEVQAVQRLFQWAKDSLRVVPENVFAKVERPPTGQRNRVLAPRDLAVMLRKAGTFFRAGRKFRDVLIAMRESIMRPQEARALIWPMLRADDPRMSLEEALPLGRTKFVLTDYKARERRKDPHTPRIIRVNRRLGRLLLRLLRRRASATGHVFLNRSNRPWSPNAIRCRMRKLRKKFPEYQATAGCGENVVAYSLRHSSATLATSRGVRDKVLAELMGHASTDMVQRYQHLCDEHLRSATEAIEDRDGQRAKREERRKEAEERRKKAG